MTSGRGVGGPNVRRLLLALVAAAVLLVASAGPALASHEVSFAIAGFGDKDCVTGSGALITGSASPFIIEVCVYLDGSPLAGHEMTAVVTHGDGETQEIAFTTDANGEATVEVVPTSAGTTTVGLCDADGCDYGTVEAKAENDPAPEPVASYTGPTVDVGATEAITDAEGDLIDAETNEAAADGAGDAAMDIESFRYLGVEDGSARFEITTRGDARSLFSDAPLASFRIEVRTPDGASYNIGYQVSDGEAFPSASSERAQLPGVLVSLEWVDESTAVLSATGVDVPAGSTITVRAWLSRDPSSSGFIDDATGTATPLAIETDPTPTDTTDTDDDETETPTENTVPVDDEDDRGSFSFWIPIVIFGIVVGGFLIYTRTRTRTKTPPPDDDDDDDPRDTPPPAIYGEEVEQPGCGWALYFFEGGHRKTLREPGGVTKICCKYFVTVQTRTHVAATHRMSRQDGSTERLRLHDVDPSARQSPHRRQGRSQVRSGRPPGLDAGIR